MTASQLPSRPSNTHSQSHDTTPDANPNSAECRVQTSATPNHRADAPQVYRTPSIASRLDLRSPSARKPIPGSVWAAVRPDPTPSPILAIPAAVAFPSSAPCTHAVACSHTSTTGVPRPNRGRAKRGSSAAPPRDGKPSRSRLGGVTTPRHRVGPRQTPLQRQKGAQPAFGHVGGMHGDSLDGADGADGASHNGAPLRSALLDAVCDAMGMRGSCWCDGLRYWRSMFRFVSALPRRARPGHCPLC